MIMHFVLASGLIHISEFSSTVSIAYLGLDAIGERDIKILEIAKHIEAVNDDLLNRLQPVKDNVLQISFDCDELYMIAHVTRHFLPEAEPSRKKRVVKWARRHCPLLWYFLDRRDLAVVPIICGISLTVFFAASLLELAEIKIPLEIALPIHLLLVVSCLWIFYTVYASFKIPNLPSAVDKKRKTLDERLKKIANESINRSISEVEKKASSPLRARKASQH